LYLIKVKVPDTLRRGGFMEEIGVENLFPARSRPVEAIYQRLDNEVCRNCSTRAFAVCQQRLPSGEVRSS